MIAVLRSAGRSIQMLLIQNLAVVGLVVSTISSYVLGLKVVRVTRDRGIKVVLFTCEIGLIFLALSTLRHVLLAITGHPAFVSFIVGDEIIAGVLFLISLTFVLGLAKQVQN